MNAIVVMQNVSRLFAENSGVAALDGISLDIERGEFAAVVGPSGSGKSTLLNLIAGLDRPTSGRVEVCGIDVGEASESALARHRRKGVGFVFQFFNLIESLTVLENVMIPAELAGVRRGKAKARALEQLEELGAAELARRYPETLSGGQRQRVALARALINAPDLVLADEPTGALDTRSGKNVMELLAAMNEAGQTVVLVTHDIKLAASYGRRILTLRDGQLADDTRLAVQRSSTAADLIGWTAEGR
jgi:putative ABC transport system ATP-binding protein